MFIQLAKDQKFYDKLSIGISIACIMHCLLFPSLLILFSSFFIFIHQWRVGSLPSSIFSSPCKYICLINGIKKSQEFSYFLNRIDWSIKSNFCVVYPCFIFWVIRRSIIYNHRIYFNHSCTL